MAMFNIHEAKSQLSRLLERAEAGEEIVIARAGTPIARLTPYRPVPAARQPGRWKGRVSIASDFDDLPDDVAAAFRGEGP